MFNEKTAIGIAAVVGVLLINFAVNSIINPKPNAVDPSMVPTKDEIQKMIDHAESSKIPGI